VAAAGERPAPDEHRLARPLEYAFRISQVDLVQWLGAEHELDQLDAYQLLTQASETPVANVVDPNYTVVSKIRKGYLPERPAGIVDHDPGAANWHSANDAPSPSRRPVTLTPTPSGLVAAAIRGTEPPDLSGAAINGGYSHPRATLRMALLGWRCRRGSRMLLPWAEVGLVLLLVVINAAFAGSEVALISLREGQLRRLEQQGGRGRLVARLARDPNQFLSTIQIGITLAGFLASAVAAVSLAAPLVPLLGFLGEAAEPAAVVLVTILLTYLTLVVGELAPKRIALQRPERWARRAARPLAGISTLTRPAVWLLSASTDLLVRLAGADPGRQREAVTEEEVRDLIATGGVFRPDQRRILVEAIEVGERRLRDVLVPRRDVVALPADASAEEAIRKLVETGHSRAPVYRNGLDDVLGIIHLRDLVGVDTRVADHVRPALALPESMGVLDALRRLQAEREQLAIVINEYGGVEGIVSLEDLLEELVGEIYDEFDPDSQAIHRQPDGSIVLPGSFPVHDLPDLDISLPEGPYATIAGLILDRLGHLPDKGETVQVDGWRLEVLDVEQRAITRVRLVPL
jgi:magnesium and cobalt exporter, CNNM family